MHAAVVIWRPREGNYHHWAFHVYDRGRQHYIFQTEGDPNELAPHVRYDDPESYDGFLKRIPLGDIAQDRFVEAREIIKGAEMQNDVSSWDCQEYTLDIMEALEKEGLLGSKPKYPAIKKAVINMRGPSDLTHQAVVGYNYHLLREEDSDEESLDESDGEMEPDEDKDEQPANTRSEELVVDSDEED